MIYTILDKRNRNPQTLQSSSYAVPGNLANKKFRLHLLLDLADRIDPAFSIRFAVQGSWDSSGINWRDLAGGMFTGGYDDEGGPFPEPDFTWQTGGEPPLFARAELEWSRRTNFGAEIEIS